MKKLSILLCLLFVTATYGQITYDQTVTIEPSSYGAKLILNDANTANKVPLEFRSNNAIKWELGTRNASEQYDLALWRYYGGTFLPVMWFNNDDGNVGIGTKTPNSKLEIESSGAIYSTEASLIVKDVLNRGTVFLESVTDKPTDFVFKNNNRFSWSISTRNSPGNYSLRFYPSVNGTSWSASALTLSVNGDIGIGTNSPDSKLTVKGRIHAEEVKVDLSVPGPDYVFKEGYDLKSLEEVQQHIQEKGHLPNIPSAAEMEENGLELGLMNMKLLEKIEELTLYMIDMNKRMELLEKENLQLKKGSAKSE
ncbi:hypothetical protein [Ulvibacterium sp.]|uniref:hypothetical protein n=1 Tax=Ulvibacterium sp. TaxID=2665914 RepID=UPI003BAD04BE